MDQKPRNVFDIAVAAGKKPAQAATPLPDEVRQGLKHLYEFILADHVLNRDLFEADGFDLDHRARLSNYVYDFNAPVLFSDLHNIVGKARGYYVACNNDEAINLIDCIQDDLSRLIQQKPKGDVRPFVHPNKKTETGVDPR